MTTGLNKKKSGFFVRLGNLIIVQGFFIFIALALILFYPVNPGSLEGGINNIQDKVIKIRDFLTRFDKKELGRQEAGGLEKFLKNEPVLQYLGLYDFDEKEQIENLFTYKKTDGSEAEINLNRNISSLIAPDYLRSILNDREGEAISFINSTRHLIFLYRVELRDKEPGVMMTVMDHDLLISSRSGLLYVLFLLFLSSTLIALLTVYLISRRFQMPLNHLMRGLEKTAEGELYYIIESDGDNEIDNLSKAFNTMTQSLWENQKKLTTFNSSLKKSNIALIESQMFLATLIESSPLCIMVTSPDDQIMIFNRMASEVFGYTGEEVIGKKLDYLFKRALSGEVLKKGVGAKQPGFEMICQRKDGQSFPAYVIVAPVKVGSRDMNVYLYIIKDITESKNFQDMMVRLDRYYTRGQMAGDIAHEINNYLAILSGNIELMPLIIKKGDQEKIGKKLEVMKTTVDKIACFADGLMDIPQDKVNFEPVDLNQLVENVLAFLKPQNKFDGIEFQLNLSAEIPLVEVDPGQVQQLLVNYIFNAADAVKTTESRKKIFIATAMIHEGNQKYTRVEVGDSGPGIPEEKQEIIFKKRFTTKRKGHGIGLVTCRKIADAHGGRVGYLKNEYATFYLDIPIVRKIVPETTPTSENLETRAAYL